MLIAHVNSFPVIISIIIGAITEFGLSELSSPRVILDDAIFHLVMYVDGGARSHQAVGQDLTLRVHRVLFMESDPESAPLGTAGRILSFPPSPIAIGWFDSRVRSICGPMLGTLADCPLLMVF